VGPSLPQKLLPAFLFHCCVPPNLHSQSLNIFDHIIYPPELRPSNFPYSYWFGVKYFKQLATSFQIQCQEMFLRPWVLRDNYSSLTLHQATRGNKKNIWISTYHREKQAFELYSRWLSWGSKCVPFKHPSFSTILLQIKHYCWQSPFTQNILGTHTHTLHIGINCLIVFSYIPITSKDVTNGLYGTFMLCHVPYTTSHFWEISQIPL
jgi:hypothetical protein